MKHISKILFSFISLFYFGLTSLHSQTNWNNIYYAPAVPNTGYSYNVKNSIAFDNKLFIYGDTMGSYMQSPYVTIFDPQNHSSTPLSLSTYSTDYTISSAAVVNTPTAGLSYIFFSAHSQSAQYPGIYKYNTQTGVTTPEQLNVGMANYYNGIDNIAFFSQSGAGNNDTLNVFANYFGSTYLYRKHYNQPLYMSSTSLPFQMVYKSIVYRDTLYVLGYDNIVYAPRLYKTSDGRTYSECVGFSTLQSNLIGASNGMDMDTLNNTLYIMLGDGESLTHILKTSDGSSFSETQAGGYYTRYVSMKNYRNKIWLCGPSMTFSAYNNNLSVAYLNSAGLDVLSVDTLGNYHNNLGHYYHLNVVNDSLYCAGYFNFSDTTDNYSGISVYKLTGPTAGISYINNIACLNTSLSFTSTSTNADSLHWYLDNTYLATSPGASANYNINFSIPGNHLVSLVAHGGGLTDTINVIIYVYGIQASLAGSTENCENVPLDLIASELGGYQPVHYQWFQSGSLSGVDSTAYFNNPGIGNYTYNCIVTDANGCIGYSDTLMVTIKTSKNILGLVTTNTLTPVPVSGNVTLYKYEPFLVKFDSISTQVIDAAGGYTFTSMTAGNYIVKAVPSASSLQITYGTSFTTWQNATTISHGCLADETKDIDVKQFASLPGLGSGLGVLTGTVIQGQGFGQNVFKPMAPGNPIGGIVVKGGRNPGGQMFTQTTTDPTTGTYTLQGLPNNNGTTTGEEYFIQVDIPGLDTNGTYHRVITSSNEIFEHLDFIVDSMYVNPINNTVGIHDINAIEHQLVVYPNPTSDKVNINFELKSISDVKIELYDIAGRLAKTLLPETNLNVYEFKQSFNLNELNSGAYFLKLSINGKVSTVKIFVTK